jgi:uncharacterized protein (DUF1499 family)
MTGADSSLPSPAVWPARITWAGLSVLLLGLGGAVASRLLDRVGVDGFEASMLLLGASVLLMILGIVLTLSGLLASLVRRAPAPRGEAVAGVGLAAAALAWLGGWALPGLGAAPIHEVSTDLSAPPAFVAVKAIREALPGVNPADYVAELWVSDDRVDVPEAQRRAYPDIQPLVLAGVSPQQAYARVEAAARKLGWEIVAAVPTEGRLEATGTTRFLGLQHDIVVRLRVEGGATRIDARSKSRQGVIDAGLNARRIREFLQLLEAL